MLRLALALGYLMTCAAQIRFFLEDTDMRLTVQHLIGKDNGVYPCHACNRGGSYDSGLQTETSHARSSTELGISTSESSRLESTMKQSTTETGWPSSTETSEQSSTQTTISDSTEFSTTSIEPRTTETGSTETIVSGTTGATESGSTETESASTEKSWRCKSAHFGCCPDNVTIAHGPNNKGCGCQYTQFGCCPDRRTKSQGPNFGGCACHTYQFGCCADGFTAATGPNFQGCVCRYSKYGCCGDETTAARGPNKEGCDCSNSKFGCCPDGITEAKGDKFLNCSDVPENKQDLPYTPRPSEQKEPEGRAEEGGKATMRCFLHGNPPPKIIWRHGEITIEGDFSRYRLLSDGALEIVSLYRNDTGVYICLADNGLGVAMQEVRPEVLGTSESSRLESTTKQSTTQTSWSSSTETTELSSTQATSSDSTKFSSTSIEPGNTGTTESGSSDTESCSNETSWCCKSAHFGCCPDNVTIANGPNNEGCGCQYTQFGCCPDRRTKSQGPNFGGCACHTYQFGCCDDGVTAATGPNFQGCVCQYSKYGCCGDEATAARGPNKEGCDCSNSKFGCCPDGVTEAKGDKFLNCSDVPENRQEACALPNDKGSCGNFSVYWFYDISYGGCVRFWYSGCEGNGNRFSSQEECEDVCVRPPPKDSCNLPKVKGICEGYNIRWYYDPSREQCSQFVYGGCQGNNNNFDSQALCQERCEPEKTEDQCNLPIEQGSCAGNFARWGYDLQRRRCEQFIWGGCEGNSNRFISEAACKLRCSPPGVPIQACSLPQDAGNCTEKHPAWSFSLTENRCIPFYNTGCGRNENRFDTEQVCDNSCPSAYDICQLPMLSGPCDASLMRWFYDATTDSCSQFTYSGCEGNENRFNSMEECERQCQTGAPATTTTISTTTTTTIAPEYIPPECQVSPTLEECRDAGEVWYLDLQQRACVVHINANSGFLCRNTGVYSSQEACERSCGAFRDLDVCRATLDPGPCLSVVPKYYWDAVSGQCLSFAYGGCHGGPNRFSTAEECEEVCRTTGPEAACLQPVSAGEPGCALSSRRWYYHDVYGECIAFVYSGCGGTANNFPSYESCAVACKRANPAGTLPSSLSASLLYHALDLT